MSCKTDTEAKDLLRRGVCVGRGEIERIGRERGWKVPEEEVSFLSWDFHLLMWPQIRRERAKMTRILFETRGKGRGKALVGGRGRGISLPVR